MKPDSFILIEPTILYSSYYVFSQLSISALKNSKYLLTKQVYTGIIKITKKQRIKEKGEQEMRKQYAVYNDNALINGIYDNDAMDWFANYEFTEKQAQELANETGLTSYLSEVVDGDFDDEPEEIEPEE